jgi:outer membrane protein assembly factor BamA
LQLHSYNTKLIKKLRYSTKHRDSISVLNEIEDVEATYRNKGYLECNADSIVWKNQQVTAYFHFGKAYKWNKISFNDSLKKLLKGEFRYREKIYTNQALSLNEFEKFNESILVKFENNGYPFVKVTYGNTTIIDSNEIATELQIDRGPRIKINKIYVKGTKKIHPKFIQTYLQIKPKSWYNEETMRNISRRIKEISFLSEIKPHEIIFTPEGAELYLYLNVGKSSNANGILGIQPNNQTGKVNVTGEVKLKLQNLLKRGELFNLEWKKLQPKTQDFLIEINYPFLFGTSFGVDGRFKLYKRDTTFLNLNANIGVQYILKGGNYLKAFYEYQSSDLLITPINFTATNIVDIRKHIYGLGFLRRQYDYLPNPRKGFGIDLTANIGNKLLKKKDDIPDSLYNGLKLKDASYGMSLKADVFIPIMKRNTIRLANQTHFTYSNDIFLNEALRLGGLNTLRGFDEEVFYATFFSVFTVEYRFLIDYRSSVFAFYDQGMFERNTRDGYVKDLPFGFGVGLNMGTKIGTFSLSYAFGKQQDQPILIRNGKIHFGYIAYF